MKKIIALALLLTLALGISGCNKQMVDLTFSYDRDCVLKEAEFCLPKGAFAAITGPSGTGKSTVLKLLLGIFTPESGMLYLRCGNAQIPLDRSTRRLFS